MTVRMQGKPIADPRLLRAATDMRARRLRRDNRMRRARETGMVAVTLVFATALGAVGMVHTALALQLLP